MSSLPSPKWLTQTSLVCACLFGLLLGTPSPVSATTALLRGATGCVRGQSRVAALADSMKAAADAAHEAFWQNSGKMVVGKQGSQQPTYLTLSFDSEIPDTDVFRLIMRDPEAARDVTKPARQISRKSLIEALRMTDKQFRFFALRPGVAKDRTAYRITDLNPTAMGNFLGNADFSGIEAAFRNPVAVAHTRARHVERMLRDDGAPIRTHLDLGSVEITHEGFEPVPSAYRATVLDLHDRFQAPSTHLHVGFPASRVSKERAHAIARAVETRILLARASVPTDWLSKVSWVSGSPLAGPSKWDARGIVRLTLNRFKEPANYHDHEIRQWMTIEDGLDNLAFASNLALARERLVVEKETFGPARARDPFSGNLEGALAYAARALGRGPTSEQKAAGHALNALAEKAKTFRPSDPEAREIEYPPAFRDEVRSTLERHHVINLLTEGAFLK